MNANVLPAAFAGRLAQNIVLHRNVNGPFRSRKALKEVPRLLEMAEKQIKLLTQAFPDRNRLAILFDARKHHCGRPDGIINGNLPRERTFSFAVLEPARLALPCQFLRSEDLLRSHAPRNNFSAFG